MSDHEIFEIGDVALQSGVTLRQAKLRWRRGLAKIRTESCCRNGDARAMLSFRSHCIGRARVAEVFPRLISEAAADKLRTLEEE
jgi:hypothetical protein